MFDTTISTDVSTEETQVGFQDLTTGAEFQALDETEACALNGGWHGHGGAPIIYWQQNPLHRLTYANGFGF